MGRRNAVKGVNANLKRNFTNVDRGWIRMFGTEKISYFLAFTLAGLNVMLAKSFRRMLAIEKELASGPKRRQKRRTRTFEEVLGPATDDGSAAADLHRGTEVLETTELDVEIDPESRAPPEGSPASAPLMQPSG